MSTPAAPPSTRVSLRDALPVWARIGVLGFGGPAGQIALMHRELVEKRRWIDEARFLHALQYCMLLPGPEAQQLATYIGWLMHRSAGAVIAGSLFVLPGALVVLALSATYAALHEVPAIAAIFYGLKAAVLAVVIEALLRIGRRALRSRPLVAIAGVSCVAIAVLDVPFPAIVIAAAIAGTVLDRVVPGAIPAPAAPSTADGPARTVIDAMAARGELAHTTPSRARAARVVVIGLLLWIVPPALVVALGVAPVIADVALLFGQGAVVTFGGAYAVLAWVAQRAVEDLGWLSAPEMLDGLGLAETTPGPLILVTEFVGFLAAYRAPGALPPMLAGTLGAAITIWVTFVPSFVYILAGAPWIEALRGSRALHAALSAITASVVGVILALALWLALHVVFARLEERHFGIARVLVPDPTSIDLVALAITVASAIALLRLRVGMLWTLLGAAVVGALARTVVQ